MYSLKISSKLGGIIYSGPARSNYKVFTNNTMVVGVYLSRASKISGTAHSDVPSVAGVVATINKSGLKFLASARLQEGGHEVRSIFEAIMPIKLTNSVVHRRPCGDDQGTRDLLVGKEQ
jgi:hypothetical protein